MNGIKAADSIPNLDEDSSDSTFEIPELPSGSRLELRLLSNWGDPHYIGLNGIEIFSYTGKRVEIVEVSSTVSNFVGDPNSLVVENFFCTDRHKLWRAEIPPEGDVRVTLLLQDVVRVAMIRIWNYSESRVRAQIGVRYLEIQLDDVLIFRGEINPSYANNEEIEPMGDTVLFTTDETILEQIAENDVCLLTAPFTNSIESDAAITDAEVAVQLTPYRPSTAEISTISKLNLNERPSSARTTEDAEQTDGKVKVLHLELLANWGHPDSIGLTGLELIGSKGLPIELEGVTITTSNGNDSVQTLLNGRNLTKSVSDMWITQWDCKRENRSFPTVTLTFNKSANIQGISVWNYNASPEMSYAGVRQMNVYINGKLAVSNVLLRKAPGYVYFDFVQDVVFDSPIFLRSIQARPSTYSIGGFIFQIRLLSTWGDEFYIGLNGIELYNRKDELIRVKSHNLAAFPESVNILPAVESDPRISANLINGHNDTDNAAHMWLTPLLPNRCARIFFVFDVPTYVSKMIVYNYRKTPARGVRHLSVSVDDLIIFSGELPQSTSSTTGSLTIDLRES